MNASDARFLLGYVLAVVVPAGVLHLSAPDERLAAGLTAAPFGWPRVLVAHLVTALPLGAVVAGWLRSVPAVNEAVRALWVVIGAALAGGSAVVCPGLGEAASGGDFGALPLLVMRGACAFVLVLPWCVWATAPPEPGAPANRQPGVRFGLGVGFALLPCGLYAEGVVAARTDQVRELIQSERIVRADVVLIGLIELGSDRLIGKKLPADLRKDAAPRIARLKRSAERPLGATATPDERFARALVLIQLERLGEAAEQLEPLAAPENDDPTLVLASVYRAQERWAASDELYSRVLEKLLPRAAADESAREKCLWAVDGLVFNARADGRPADVERVLNRALEALPTRAAEFHFQLGRHYNDGGRHARALEHLREAVRLDPTAHSGPADQLIHEMRSSTPACVLSRSP